MANSADPDQTPLIAASDHGLHCLQIVKSFFFRKSKSKSMNYKT